MAAEVYRGRPAAGAGVSARRPARVPAGIFTLTWFKPTQQPASPAKAGVTGVPSIVTVTLETVLDTIAGNAPVDTNGDTWPNPVA